MRTNAPKLSTTRAGPFGLGLCARSVLNLQDRVQGSQVASRLTVGKQRFQRFTDFGISCAPLVCDFSSCDGAIANQGFLGRQRARRQDHKIVPPASEPLAPFPLAFSEYQPDCLCIRDIISISVKQSCNPRHLPCPIRLLAECSQSGCNRRNRFAAVNRSECAFHFCDFKCPVATNGQFWIENSLQDSKAFKKSALSSFLPRMQRPSP